MGLSTLTARVVRASASRVKRSNDENNFRPSRFVYYHLVTLTRMKVQRWDVSASRTLNYVTITNFHLLIPSAAAMMSQPMAPFR